MAHAGSAFFDFNSDPTAGGIATLFGSANWQSSDGAGAATNSSDGYLQITAAQNSLVGAIVFADIDNGAIVGGLHVEADVRIGNGSNPVADGVSIDYARAGDPVLTAPTSNGNWGTDAGGGNGNGPEEATLTGIGVGFDSYSNDGGDPIGLDIRVDGKLTSFPMPTLNGSVTDPTSIQTGPYDGTGNPDTLGWAHLIVDLNTNGILNVYYKGAHVLKDYASGYVPGPGQLLVAGRTGGYNQNQDFDNISITTTTVLAALGPITALSDGVQFTLYDSGPSVVNPNTISFTINGGSPITPAPSSITKSGTITTVVYHEYPTLFPSGSTNQLAVSFKDNLNNNLGVSREFITPTYTVIPAADAVTGVNTSLPGYRIMPWQSPNVAGSGEPNSVHWMQEQLVGLHGANNADLTTATDGGYIDFNNIINFNLWGIYAGFGNDNGDFQSPNYPDVAFPGIPGGNGLTGSIALEFLTFLQFSQPGVYTMGVNSDDGFVVTEGANPRDRFAPVLGQYNGGRGSSDTLFTMVVPTAGIYPFRLAYENGAGEGSGNGANLEWFLVDTNGAKILINDPSSTNDTGVKAFYKGPALPAFVSQINPYIGQGDAVPHKAIVQLTDGSTTVNQGSIQFTIDGAALGTQSVTKSGSVTTVEQDFLSTPLAPGSAHTATLVWSDGAGSHSNSWPFTVESYSVANAGQSVASSGVDTTKPGFELHVTQIDPATVNDSGDGIANQADMANSMLAGLPFPWYGTNTVDTTTVPSVASNMWYWTQAMDFNDSGSAGDFTYDYTTPGIPGVTLSINNFAESFDGWLVIPTPGYYRFSVSSDDGYRLSPGIGLLRQVLHIQGAHVNRDVAVVVSDTLYGNGGIGTNPPVSPISAPVVYLNTNNYTLGAATNLAGKIVAIDQGLFGISDAAAAALAQTNGALAFISINKPTSGLPYVMNGNAGVPITIPTIMVSGFGGERDTWITNTDLTASIGASQSQIWGAADYGKGMGRVDAPVIIPAAGAYPIHLTKYQGGGGVGMEFQQYQGYDGIALGAASMVLIDDPAVPSSLQAYRAVTIVPAPTISISRQGVITYTGVLRSSATVNGTYTAVAGASSPYTIPTSASAMFYRAASN